MDIIDNYFPAFAFYENRRKTTNILSKQAQEVKYDKHQLNIILARVTRACGLAAHFLWCWYLFSLYSIFDAGGSHLAKKGMESLVSRTFRRVNFIVLSKLSLFF